MFSRLNHRAGHYLLLGLVTLATTLPNLGAPSLWDIDEGHNAEAAREMLASGNWIMPTFNFQLRVDKPALLYWLQIAAYQVCGVNEFAARLPSALAALVAVLAAYELGRAMFGAATGLVAGLVLASTAMFCAAAHFANPDALLNALTLLTFLFFWRSYAVGGRGWFVPVGVCTGLAVLAKGPVGLVLPAGVLGLFLLSSRQLGRLWDRRLLAGLAVFALVALPWYALVGSETKADFLRGFFLTHNVGRFLSPMENHRGPVYYYAVVLLIGFVPWSAFFGPATWSAVQEWRGNDGAARPALRFLACWVAVYFTFFSLASTKLPNYILPLYPAVAILVGRFFARWQAGAATVPRWALAGSLACLALIGVGVAAGFVVAGGAVEVQAMRGRGLPGLVPWAFVAFLPVVGAAAAWWAGRRQRRAAAVGAVAASAVLFVGALAASAAVAVDRHKAPRRLVQEADACQLDREVRVGCYAYYQPSLVFYCRREVERFAEAAQALEFLDGPLEAFLFVPASVWADLGAQAGKSYRILGRQRDLYRGCDVLVVTNR
jgi:4-amino-4-deoxy-L-arabinose transferase-like glycosyltransferase